MKRRLLALPILLAVAAGLFWQWPRFVPSGLPIAVQPAASAAGLSTSAALPMAEAMASQVAPPVDPHDAAWCALPELEFPTAASEPIGVEQAQALRAASPREQQLDAAIRQLTQDWADALAARGDERSRALSLRLQASADPQARMRLLELARGSSDPAVYAWGLRSCPGERDCAGLTPLQWARLDPGNRQPWQWLADQARQRGDLQGLQDALHKIGQSSRSESYEELLQRQLADLSRATQPGLMQMAELTLRSGLYFATPWPSVSSMTRHCESRALQDANRQQQCAGLAEVLWLTNPNLLEASIAVALARRLPQRPAVWVERAEELEARRQALQELQEKNMALILGANNSCAGLPALRELFDRQLVLGEWALTGQALAGRDRAELARRWRASPGSWRADAVR